MRILRAAFGLAASCCAVPAAAQNLQSLPFPEQGYSFEGPFGTFDLASVQRGYAVYSQVCASCHSMKQVTFRDLSGLGLDQDQIHDIAAGQPVPGGTDATGNVVLRAATPDDHFRLPYANDVAARAANNGALPPDQSRLAKTISGGPSFIQAYLTGFRDAPPNVTLPAGMHYNDYVPGNSTAMPDPLQDGQVKYADGTKSTKAQMAHDVTTYLAWTANPHLEERRRTGIRVMVYLLLLLGLVFVFKRKVWANVRP
jgi:ubiquinol-cytochrome c reductase cytochrome c1 subunit